MTLKPWLIACIALFAATPALAHSSSARPLNLDLPLPFTPAAAGTTHGAAKSARASKPRPHSAHLDDSRDTGMETPYASLPTCDNEAYKKPRVFGNVELGAFSGSHIDGNYEAGRVSVGNALGNCNHPSGGITVSFGFGRATINGPSRPR